jgi:hypothetical protein
VKAELPALTARELTVKLERDSTLSLAAGEHLHAR